MSFLNQFQDAINQGFVNAGSSLPYPLQPSTSANPYGTYAGIGKILDAGIGKIFSNGKSSLDFNPPLNNAERFSQSGSAAGVSRSPVPPSVIDYLNADLAKHYGLGKETAYQEALSNTSYQRAVADMKAAGLNPAAIFGSGKGYTAGGVSYVSSPSTSSGSGTQKNDYLFSEGVYHAISTACGIVGAILTKSPTGYWVASSSAQGIMGAMNTIFK